jgi:hypothetical protein
MTASRNFHAGSRSSQEYLYDVDVPTPSHAERARTMASMLTTGTLSTLAATESELAGHPYGSLVTTALHDGNPVFLISGLAVHTQNLRKDGRSSVMLSEAGDENPLALGRITLVGQCSELDEGAVEGAKTAYLDVHPQAEFYLSYGDFSFWRLAVRSVRYIGGFGRMSWLSVDEWFAAEPDPIAPSATAIIRHMNDDHVKAMTDYCKAFTQATEFSEVKMTGVDRYGFEMSVKTADGWRPIRLAFDEPVTTPQQVRTAMVAMAAKARAATR